MDSLWSMSTTVRDANRIYGFLNVAKKIEGEVWNNVAPYTRPYYGAMGGAKNYFLSSTLFYLRLLKSEMTKR